MIDHLKRYETGNWEPTSSDVIRSMTRSGQWRTVPGTIIPAKSS